MIEWLLSTPVAQAPVIVALLPPLLALIAIVVAWRTAIWVARQKATIDMIEKRESTDYYREISGRFSALRRGAGFAHLHDPAPDDAEDRRRVVAFLNHYELVALGIRRGTLSGGFYKRWMGGPFVRDWNAALDWIERERWKYDATTGRWLYDRQVYRSFERVACRWSRDARRPAGPAVPPAGTAHGVGDEPLPDLTGLDDRQPAAD